MRTLFFIASLLFWSHSFAQKNDLTQADKDIKWLKEKFGFRSDSVQSPLIYQPLRDEQEAVQLRSKRAAKIYQKAITEPQLKPEKYIDLTIKLALSIHFQIDDFSYGDSLPPEYGKSLQLIEKALDHDQKRLNGKRQGELYLMASKLAAPHFYYAYLGKTPNEAEERAFTYLNKAGKAFLSQQDSLQALHCWRAVGNRSLDQSLQLFEFALQVEGEKSVKAAVDISHTYHQSYYQDILPPDRMRLEKTVRKALWIYNQQPISNYEQDIRIRLYRDLGYYQLHQTKHLDSALFFYQCAQDIEIATERKLYYTAFFLGAVQLQLKNYELARKQYQLAQKNTKLSRTDLERSWFGIVMSYYLDGKKKTAKETWKKRIGDQKIMNGISAFYGYINEDHRPKVKQKALNLVDQVEAPNAKRIIEDGWN